MMALISRCKVKNVSRDEESIGFFVVDISVVAIRKLLSQSEMRPMASQSVLVSRQSANSPPAVISETMYVLTASLKSRARPIIIDKRRLKGNNNGPTKHLVRQRPTSLDVQNEHQWFLAGFLLESAGSSLHPLLPALRA
jgi:hypothetical protein